MTSGADDAQAAHELDLVTRAAQGDGEAFDRFFEKNASAVQLLVERLLGPGEAADAVVVEAFEKTVRRLPLLGARNSSPALYVLATARNGAYASLGRGRPTPPDGPLGVLLSLPSRQRELLALRELGLSEAECAEVAGIEPGEVGVQVARARLRLTDGLEGLTLSSVFADDRAERLLAAEVVRAEGAPLPNAQSDEISRLADEDARFAGALSAVRSPSRSVGQLPPVSGAARLVAQAREGSVGASRPAKPAAAAGGFVAVAAGVAAASSVASASPPEIPSSPAAQPTGDPYDDSIGDEMAWGIVEDEDDAPPFQASTGRPATPAVPAPTDQQWEDGAGAVSGAPSVPSPGTPAPPVPLPSGEAADSDPALTDPFAGWEDVDWGDEDREWEAGPAPAVDSAAAAGGPPADGDPPTEATKIVPVAGAAAAGAAAAGTPVPDLGETRAFDAVAAGLVDPDPVVAPLAPHAPAGGPPDGGDAEPPARRSKWRYILWAVVLLALFAGAALAAYAVSTATQDPELPPASSVTQTSPKSESSSTKPADPSETTTPKKSSSNSNDDSTSSSNGASNSSSSSSTGGSGGGSTSTGGSSTGSSGSSSTGSGGGSSGSTGSGGAQAPADNPEPVVSGGETSSGGSVRGSTDSGATTP